MCTWNSEETYEENNFFAPFHERKKGEKKKVKMKNELWKSADIREYITPLHIQHAAIYSNHSMFVAVQIDHKFVLLEHLSIDHFSADFDWFKSSKNWFLFTKMIQRLVGDQMSNQFSLVYTRI